MDNLTPLTEDEIYGLTPEQSIARLVILAGTGDARTIRYIQEVLEHGDDAQELAQEWYEADMALPSPVPSDTFFPSQRQWEIEVLVGTVYDALHPEVVLERERRIAALNAGKRYRSVQGDENRKYVAAARRAIDNREPAIEKWLTTKCTECGAEPDEGDAEHIFTAEGYILIGCEGYWIINPNALGIDRPNWDDWTDY